MSGSDAGCLDGCGEEELAGLYSRCQRAYFGKYGFYYLRARSPDLERGFDIRRARQIMDRLRSRYGWHNGVCEPSGRVLAQMRIDFESPAELGLKLAAMGF